MSPICFRTCLLLFALVGTAAAVDPPSSASIDLGTVHPPFVTPPSLAAGSFVEDRHHLSKRIILGREDEQGPSGWDCELPEGAQTALAGGAGWTWDCIDPDTFEASTCALSSTTPTSASDVVWVCKPLTSCARTAVLDWDLELHVIALVVVLCASVLGAAIPLLALPFIAMKWPARLLFGVRHAGTGVFLSTAFVHLLYESFTDFSNPCLGKLVFQPAAPVIALASLLVIFALDYTFARYLHRRAVARRRSRLPVPMPMGADTPTDDVLANAHACGTIPPAQTLQKDVQDKADMQDVEAQLARDEAAKQARMDVYLLEAGIVFHSVSIGVALGAGGGKSWLAFWIAICFHQAFEGLGLGSRIALLDWPPGQAWRKWLLASIFGFITPFGMAIGMALHTSYNPTSAPALLSVAVLNSISAGLLLYAGVVELLVADFMRGELARAGWGRVLCAGTCVLVGAGAMSAVGQWA